MTERRQMIDSIAKGVFKPGGRGDVATEPKQFERDRIGVVEHQQPIAEAVAAPRRVPAGDTRGDRVQLWDVSAVHRQWPGYGSRAAKPVTVSLLRRLLAGRVGKSGARTSF